MSNIKLVQVGQNLNIVINKKVITVKLEDKTKRDSLKSSIEKYNALKDKKSIVSLNLLKKIQNRIDTVQKQKDKEAEAKKIEKKKVKKQLKELTSTKEEKIEKKVKNISSNKKIEIKEEIAKEEKIEKPREERTSTSYGRERYR